MWQEDKAKVHNDKVIPNDERVPKHTSALGGEQSTVMSLSICLFVCVSISWFTCVSEEPHVQIFKKESL